jgi:hypothetical protein
MTTSKSIRRDNHIIPIPGKKGTTYKVLIRRKVNGINETFCETYKKLKEARAARDKILGDSNLLSRLGGAGARTTFGEIADRCANDHTGKDDRFPQRLGYWKDVFGTWNLPAITHPIIAEEYHRLYRLFRTKCG